jgi:hypothetical protein
MCCAAAVTNGANKVLSTVAVPTTSNSALTFKLRDDGKAAVIDAAGKCIMAWGTVPKMPMGC